MEGIALPLEGNREVPEKVVAIVREVSVDVQEVDMVAQEVDRIAQAAKGDIRDRHHQEVGSAARAVLSVMS